MTVSRIGLKLSGLGRLPPEPALNNLAWPQIMPFEELMQLIKRGKRFAGLIISRERRDAADALGIDGCDNREMRRHERRSRNMPSTSAASGVDNEYRSARSRAWGSKSLLVSGPELMR